MSESQSQAIAYKPPLSFWQILSMSVGFFGIQHGFAIQFARMSSIYEKLGAKPDEIPLLWLAAPMTGLLVNPIVGYLSDRTWCWLGRRRPYFLGGAILSSIALFLMPYSSALWMAAGLLWILDASINISMGPFRAFVADKLSSSQVGTGYALQAVMIGLGGFLGNAIASIDWVARYPGLAAYGSSMHIQFFLCGVIFIVAVLFTVVTNSEDAPENIEEFERERKANSGVRHWAKETYEALFAMPGPMKRLAVVQFFTWMGLFCMWMYFSVTVAHHVFGATDPHSPLYEEGIAAASRAFAWQQVVSTAFAFLIPVLVKYIGRTWTHTLGLLCGGLGLALVFFANESFMLMITMTGVGIAWATILSMPYALIADYIPKEKYGIYMGVFNMFIVIPEILAAVALGWVMLNVFGNNHIYAVTIGGAFMLLAAFLVVGLRKYEKKA